MISKGITVQPCMFMKTTYTPWLHECLRYKIFLPEKMAHAFSTSCPENTTPGIGTLQNKNSVTTFLLGQTGKKNTQSGELAFEFQRHFFQFDSHILKTRTKEERGLEEVGRYLHINWVCSVSSQVASKHIGKYRRSNGYSLEKIKYIASNRY